MSNDMEEAWIKIKRANLDHLQPNTRAYSLAYRIFKAGYAAGKASQPNQGGWVPIGEMPEEWKYGRQVLLWATVEGDAHTYSRHLAYCEGYHDGDVWVSIYADNHDRLLPTHAMLPPNPPPRSGEPIKLNKDIPHD